ncbi:MAG: hypothetical protein VX278_12160 [Myxococcota bacterium]|nr:hypothetical protein [Myxococcota bacterium]
MLTHFASIIITLFACSAEIETEPVVVTEERAPIVVDLTIQPVQGSLELSEMEYTNIHLLQLLNKGDLEPIEDLVLRQNRLNGDAIKILSRSKRLSELKSLDLSYNKIGNKGAKRLSKAKFLSSVETINLERTDLGPKGSQKLIASPYFKPKEVIIGSNKLTSRAAVPLSILPSIVYLDISSAHINKEGCARILAQTNAETLKMGKNQIGFPEDNILSSNLRELWLTNSRLQNESVLRLSEQTAPNLKLLYLGKIFINDSTLKQLTQAPWFEQIEFLSLDAPTTSPQARKDFLKAYGSHRWIEINKDDFESEE